MPHASVSQVLSVTRFVLLGLLKKALSVFCILSLTSLNIVIWKSLPGDKLIIRMAAVILAAMDMEANADLCHVVCYINGTVAVCAG